MHRSLPLISIHLHLYFSHNYHTQLRMGKCKEVNYVLHTRDFQSFVKRSNVLDTFTHKHTHSHIHTLIHTFSHTPP